MRQQRPQVILDHGERERLVFDRSNTAARACHLQPYGFSRSSDRSGNV